MKALFDDISERTSRMVTNSYSTYFSLGVKFLGKKFHNPIYAIYGFVRFADEIVDTFHQFDKKILLDDFKVDTYKAIKQGISLNPVLNNFQKVVNEYQIDHKLIDTFLHSMEMDLTEQTYDQQGYEEYILGSAEVVGLMCLNSAMKLGAAFQKINFLRDFKADVDGLGRMYFPQLLTQAFNDETKREIEADIIKDFAAGYEGIKQLPKDVRLGVYVAYMYYNNLLKKIINMPVNRILEERIRIPDNQKYALFFGSYIRHSFNML
jgi:phytoene/squalene synthetase